MTETARYPWPVRSLPLAAVLALLCVLPPARDRRDAPMNPSPSMQASVVTAASAGARFNRLVAARGDVYVIDAAAHHLRRYILHGLPYAEQFTQVMRWKEGANDLIMGQPLDLFLAGQRLLILDSLGTLWSYWGPGYLRSLVPLRLQSNQGAPVAVALHGVDLLLLDPAKMQVWQYASSGGAYDTTPRPLLARRLALLAGAVRLAVSRDALLVLRANGSLVAIPWSDPGAATMLRLPSRVTGLWASPARRRFLVSTARDVALLAPAGALVWRIRVGGLGDEPMRDVALSPTGRLYVLTETRILLLHGTVPAL